MNNEGLLPDRSLNNDLIVSGKEPRHLSLKLYQMLSETKVRPVYLLVACGSSLPDVVFRAEWVASIGHTSMKTGLPSGSKYMWPYP